MMKSIAVGPRRVNLPYAAPDGTRPLVVATPNEHISAVIARVAAAGGAANVALAEARKFVVFVMRSEDEDVPDAPGEISEDVNEDMSMGMLLLRASRRGRKTSYRLRSGATIASPLSEQFAYAS
ncbi:hypothetical protein [Microbacterium sp. AG238]|uniref:hypothetical protein n=1 Tax=Microbacterium sp. AG238 TaxID=2183994 RepID=UPI0011C4A510|nr:hypothetical protein [Microbacterium sp. AG238]